MERQLMLNIQNVSTATCHECLHESVCKYKSQLSDIEDKVRNSFNLVEDHPFKLQVNCSYKSKVSNATCKTPMMVDGKRLIPNTPVSENNAMIAQNSGTNNKSATTDKGIKRDDGIISPPHIEIPEFLKKAQERGVNVMSDIGKHETRDVVETIIRV